MLPQLLASRAFYLTLALAVNAVVPAFDASANDAHSIATRWDVLHFKDIADHGYRWEHQYAFLPAIPLLLRHMSSSGLFLLNTALAYDAAMALYALSLHHFGRQDISRFAALLSLIPFSPATLYLAPYTEPFFTYLSYRGMLCCARKQWYQATLYFTLASTFRSNGLFLCGFTTWGILFPYLQQKRLPSISDLFTAFISASLILSPFIGHNVTAFFTFCLSPAPPQWCSNSLPLIYDHVQSTYWNVGLFKYWTLGQLPNFLIALPPLFALFSYSIRYLLYFAGAERSADPFFDPSITPHAIHALVMASILLFASHTQIVLRLAPSMPFTYWGAAYIMCHPKDHPLASRIWIPWLLVWSVVSVVLWVAFLPPA